MQEQGKKQKQKHTAKNGPNGQNTRRGEGEAARPKRKQETRPGPRDPKRNEETPKTHGKTPERTERALMDSFGIAKPLSHASVSRTH